MRKLTVLLLLVLCLPAFAAKQRDWKDAKLISVSTDDTGSAAVIPVGGILYGAKIYQTNYVFETPDMVIAAATRGKKPLNLTVNKSLKIAIENQKLYVIDDGGKEIKLPIVGKRAK